MLENEYSEDKFIMVTFSAQKARNGISGHQIPNFFSRGLSKVFQYATDGLFAESALGKFLYEDQDDIYKIKGIIYYKN